MNRYTYSADIPRLRYLGDGFLTLNFSSAWRLDQSNFLKNVKDKFKLTADNIKADNDKTIINTIYDDRNMKFIFTAQFIGFR